MTTMPGNGGIVSNDPLGLEPPCLSGSISMESLRLCKFARVLLSLIIATPCDDRRPMSSPTLSA